MRSRHHCNRQNLAGCHVCDTYDTSEMVNWDSTHRGSSLKEKYGTKMGRELLELEGWRKPIVKRTPDERELFYVLSS